MSQLRLVLYDVLAGENPERTTLSLRAYEALGMPDTHPNNWETWTQGLLRNCGVIENGDPNTFIVNAPGVNFAQVVTAALI